MKLSRCVGIVALPLALCGCLEVKQHPGWLEGGYAGKLDQLPYMQHFYRDRLAWSAAVSNRTLYQNEYVRAKPPGMAAARRPQASGAAGGPAQAAAGAVQAAPGSPEAAAASGAIVAPAPGAPASAPGAGVAQPGPGSASPAASGAVRPPATR